MSDTVIVALITAVVAIVTALPLIIAQLILLRRETSKLHKEVNSRFTEWKEDIRLATLASNIASKAEGIKEQKEKDRPK